MKRPPAKSPSITRDFTVATFVVHQSKVLLLWHRKLQMWLPPGGHIEAAELPDEAAIREVAEETGLAVVLLGESGVDVASPRQLVRPAGVQLEDISPGHQHIDLIYFAWPADPDRVTIAGNDESEQIDWFGPADMAERGVNDEIRQWSRRAIALAEDQLARTS